MVNNYSTVHCFLFCFPFTIYLFTITTVFGSAHRIDANMVLFYRGDCRCQYGTVYNILSEGFPPLEEKLLVGSGYHFSFLIQSRNFVANFQITKQSKLSTQIFLIGRKFKENSAVSRNVRIRILQNK